VVTRMVAAASRAICTEPGPAGARCRMTAAIQAALNPGVRRRELFGWAMYDFANSGYTTVVLTAVYATYFVGGIAQKADWAPFAWTLALSISYAIVMLTTPAIGARADRLGTKKRYLGMATLGCIAATAALALPQPGQVALAMLLVVLSNTFFSYGESLSAAFLPELARKEALGRVSGWGWSFGYVGGMLALGLSLAYVITAQSKGVVASSFVPVTMLITAGIFAAAACVTLALLRERKATQSLPSERGAFAQSWLDLKQSLRDSAQFPDFRTLLLCAVFYQGGVAVAITLAAVYAESVIGFKQQETMALIFVLNVAAAVGAFGFGYYQDRVGHRRALGFTLVGWIFTCVLAAAASSKGVFWVAAAVAGICMGSSQSAGRAMAGMLAPQHRLAEFYGLWTFATRLASIIGPLSYGAITWATQGNQRIAILSTAALFVASLVILKRIDMTRGRQAAVDAESEASLDATLPSSRAA
jgi:MFS transporter, UMF1 family